MATHPLTVQLPEAVYQQLIEIAQLTNSSPEAIAAERIAINIPPSVSNAPPEIQPILLKMQTLPIRDLQKPSIPFPYWFWTACPLKGRQSKANVSIRLSECCS